MEIRKLEGKERYDAYLTAVYCFHMRVEDVEAKREECEKDTTEDWGAYDDKGKLMGRILNNKYEVYLDGKPVRMGGIGAVACLPEYRNSGAVKEIFKKLIPEAYKNGEVISALYPFKHEFYRKQGYEVLTAWNEYSMAPALLCKYRFDGEVVKWEPGDSVADFLKVYEEFAPKFNFAKERNEQDFTKLLKVDKPYIDRKFSYVMKKEGRPVAYVVFTDIRNDPAAILQVDECAWTNREGFNAILGFLARFESDYGTVKLTLPKGIDLARIINTPVAYDVTKTPGQAFMVRVINAAKLLELIYKPADCDFTVKLTDEMIEENNGVFRVTNAGVTKTDDSSADLDINIRTLGQLAVGCLNLDEAMLKNDVTVYDKEEMLRRVFVEKNIFVSEHF